LIRSGACATIAAVPRRVRSRSPVGTWTGRLLAALGTAAVLAVGAVAASMVLSTDGDDGDVATAAPRAEPTAETKARKRRAPKLTPEQRAQRDRATAELRRQGYAPAGLADYKVDQLLRVLIGRPVGDTPPGMRAFFFVDDEYIGLDATSPSGKLRAGRQLEREITLVYTLYEDGDRACCPEGGDERVHFRWNGEALEPREPIPPDAERLR
jgi:LppP/LprE lipoprotein